MGGAMRSFAVLLMFSVLGGMLFMLLGDNESPGPDGREVSASRAELPQIPQVYYAIGDSITFGAGIRDRASKSYPAQLGKLLGAGYEVRNFGNSGSTMLKKGDKPFWKQRQWAATLAFNPNNFLVFASQTMANRSPPIPLLTGSTSPSTALAAMAASVSITAFTPTIPPTSSAKGRASAAARP